MGSPTDTTPCNFPGGWMQAGMALRNSTTGFSGVTSLVRRNAPPPAPGGAELKTSQDQAC